MVSSCCYKLYSFVMLKGSTVLFCVEGMESCRANFHNRHNMHQNINPVSFGG